MFDLAKQKLEEEKQGGKCNENNKKGQLSTIFSIIPGWTYLKIIYDVYSKFNYETKTATLSTDNIVNYYIIIYLIILFYNTEICILMNNGVKIHLLNPTTNQNNQNSHVFLFFSHSLFSPLVFDDFAGQKY